VRAESERERETARIVIGGVERRDGGERPRGIRFDCWKSMRLQNSNIVSPCGGASMCSSVHVVGFSYFLLKRNVHPLVPYLPTTANLYLRLVFNSSNVLSSLPSFLFLSISQTIAIRRNLAHNSTRIHHWNRRRKRGSNKCLRCHGNVHCHPWAVSVWNLTNEFEYKGRNGSCGGISTEWYESSIWNIEV
jgi:hypothetical protein